MPCEQAGALHRPSHTARSADPYGHALFWPRDVSARAGECDCREGEGIAARMATALAGHGQEDPISGIDSGSNWQWRVCAQSETKLRC